ncbi:phosphopentomutase [Lachnospiraceae bacterium XBB2008]|nr:phosphopentomutase [Lachnospiraceae bacterium XBB2008]
MPRVFLIVLDSFGIGEMPDADRFGDVGANTIRSCASDPGFIVPNMKRLGLMNIDGVDLPDKEDAPEGAFARLAERSNGKDTTIGHWEIAGIYSPNALPTYPNGFPDEVIDEFKSLTGRGVLCNKPYSGTVVINEYGDEHMRTGDLIVYTSADSVFQIAAHEDIVPVEQLYEYCRMAREMLKGEHAVGRVIARPFIGTSGAYTRTPRRHDFSLLPPSVTMLDQIKEAGMDVISVGKIYDIFAGKGITESNPTTGNPDGIDKTLAIMDRDFNGICFTNLVDTDMIYGHRRDIPGYAGALSYFDEKLPLMLDKMREDDYLMITADHGCDPGFTKSTDHTREYIPFLMTGSKVKPGSRGTRTTFADIGATVLDIFGITPGFTGTSML